MIECPISAIPLPEIGQGGGGVRGIVRENRPVSAFRALAGRLPYQWQIGATAETALGSDEQEN